MVSPEAKNILQSKTVWGVLVLLASFLMAKFMGVEIGEDEQASLVEQIMPLMEDGGAVIGTLLAIWGRMSATKKVTLL